MDLTAISPAKDSIALPDQQSRTESAKKGVPEPRNTAEKPVERSVPDKADPREERKQLEDVVKSANKLVESLNRYLKFSIDDATDRIVVKVVDGNTNEVIRQIPSDEMLKLAARIDEINGVLFNGKY